MNGAVNIRQEVFEIIGKMSERKLYALRDFLIIDTEDDDTLSAEELTLFLKCERDRVEHPDSFTDWRHVRREA